MAGIGEKTLKAKPNQKAWHRNRDSTPRVDFKNGILTHLAH
jgi:hypothetical protein